MIGHHVGVMDLMEQGGCWVEKNAKGRRYRGDWQFGGPTSSSSSLHGKGKERER